MSEEYNGEGHGFFTIFGRNLLGVAEIDRLEAAAFTIPPKAQPALTKYPTPKLQRPPPALSEDRNTQSSFCRRKTFQKTKTGRRTIC
jgi:hypothetical protein